MTTPKCRDRETTIAFRLGRPYTDRLEASAQVTGLSRGQYARLILVMHFEDTALHRLEEALIQLKREVADLNQDYASDRRADHGEED